MTCPIRRPQTWFTVVLLLTPLVGSSVAFAQEARFDSHSRTRGLGGGWGHSWSGGFPGYGKTESDVAFIAFHPQMGWFLTDCLELYGEGSLLIYHEPKAGVAGGLVGIAGRYHLWNDRSWTPYLTTGAGLLWTSLDVSELDRVFNFQVIVGAGVRLIPETGPGLILEFRNHHMSNAGTAGENLGVNAVTVIAGAQWILRQPCSCPSTCRSNLAMPSTSQGRTSVSGVTRLGSAALM